MSNAILGKSAKLMGFLTRWNIIRRTSLEELCMVVFLCNNYHKLGAPLLVKKFACLEILTNIKYMSFSK